MPKSATDIMQEIVFSAVVDAVVALKGAAGGVPNALVRDLNAIHANTAFADLPAEVRGAVQASVRAAFTRLRKDGYQVSAVEAAAAAPKPRPRAPAPAAPVVEVRKRMPMPKGKPPPRSR